MRKLFILITIISITFTSCKNNSDKNGKKTIEENVDNFSGKWSCGDGSTMIFKKVNEKTYELTFLLTRNGKQKTRNYLGQINAQGNFEYNDIIVSYNSETNELITGFSNCPKAQKVE